MLTFQQLVECPTILSWVQEGPKKKKEKTFKLQYLNNDDLYKKYLQCVTIYLN